MKKYSKYHFPILLLLMAAGLVSVSCADEDLSNNANGRNGVSFAVSDVQDAPDADLPTLTKSKEAYLTRSINFNEAGTADMCLQESTVPGVNPMKRTPQTRAWLKSTIDANFGAFACPNGSPNPSYFDNEPVSPSGQMLQPKSWGSTASTLKFYAVYPYMDGTNAQQKLVYPTTGSLPYVEFEASTDIANQTDLMTAETATINYTATGGAPHVVPLKFYHALTAIRFGIGSNLSWNKTIKSIEFQGIYKAGHFDLATKAWSSQGGIQNFKLDNVNQSTSGTLNTVIVKDGNTFLMVPQTLPSGAKIVITFTDNSHITANIGGKTWAAGTTKTYMITERNSNWDYKLETTSPADIAYDQTTSTTPYTIKSYRQSPGGVQQEAVAWKVISYSESTDGGTTWGPETQNKPDWLTNLSLTEGTGGTAAESGQATVKKATIIDRLAPRQAALKLNPRGTAGNYYDLSTHDVKGIATQRSTANCYLIAHPGFYKLPLVYGNAITKGITKTNSYVSSQPPTTMHVWDAGPRDAVLHNFKDHADQNITDPWIEKTNGGANSGIDGAKIVWADEPNLVHDLAVVRDAAGDAYLQFEVKAADIKCGNAVVAATKGGTVVWSWHLWFTAEEALNTVKVTTPFNMEYNIPEENIGWKYTEWRNTTYTKPRKVKVKVQQTAKNGANYKDGTIIITQKSYSARKGYNTLYQFGYHNAIPGTDDIKEGSYTPVQMTVNVGLGTPTIGTFIQKVGTIWGANTFYVHYYTNMWSSEETNLSHDRDNVVVKTVYDPSPAGFNMPPLRTFYSFIKDDNYYHVNASGPWNDGWDLYNKRVNPDATLFFPKTTFRNEHGSLQDFIVGLYWMSLPNSSNGLRMGYGMGYSNATVTVLEVNPVFRLRGLSVRPVAEQ